MEAYTKYLTVPSPSMERSFAIPPIFLPVVFLKLMNSHLFGVHALVAPVSNVNVTEDEVITLNKDTLLLSILAIHPQIEFVEKFLANHLKSCEGKMSGGFLLVLMTKSLGNNVDIFTTSDVSGDTEEVFQCISNANMK